MTKNFLFTGVSIGSRLLTGLLLFILLARLWGPFEFGLFSFVFSLVALVVLITDFGFAGYLLREIGANPEKLPVLFSDGVKAKSWLLVPCLIVSVVLMFALGEAVPADLYIPLFIGGVLLSYCDFCIAPLRALGRYDIETGVVVSANCVQFILAATVAWNGGEPTHVAWTIVVSRVFFLSLAWLSLRHVAPLIQSYRTGESIQRTFCRVLPYGIDGLLTTAWSQLDVVLVRALFGIQAAGVYAAGQKIVQGGIALAPVFGNVLIPKLSRLGASHITLEFKKESIKSIIIFSVVGVVLSFPLVFFSEQIASLMFGDDYIELPLVLKFLGVALLLRYLAAAFGVLLTALGLQRMRVRSQLTGLSLFLIGTAVSSWLDLSFIFFMSFYILAICSVFLVNVYVWISQLRLANLTHD